MSLLWFLSLCASVFGVYAASSDGRIFCHWACICYKDKVFSGLFVDCANRNLHTIPKDIPVNASTLWLFANEFYYVRNSTFIKLVNLKYLDLSSNCIATLEEGAFLGLENLVFLKLSSNYLPLSPSSYPNDVFKPLVSLQTLFLSRYLNTPERTFTTSDQIKISKTYWYKGIAERLSSHNYSLFCDLNVMNMKIEFDYPDRALSHLVDLEHLYLDGLTNKTFGPAFRRMTKLTKLTFDGMYIGPCHIVTVTNETFANVPSLKHLNLTCCDITVLTANAFSVLKDLRTLDLSFNEALGFDLLGEAFFGLTMTKLEILTVNNIVSIFVRGLTISVENMRHFRNITTLHTVIAEENRIESFDEGVLCQCIPPSLKYVYMNGNPLVIAPYFKELWCLENLELLQVNAFKPEYTPQFLVPTYLSSNDKHKKGISKQVFYGLPVRDLYEQELVLPPQLKYVQMTKFGLFYNFYNTPVNPNNSLLRIEASGNHFPYLDGPITGLNKLTELYLQDVFCENISPTFFREFTQLEVLDISGNPLRLFIERDEGGTLFSSLLNLKTLVLSRLNIGNINSATLLQLVNVEHLDLSMNEISNFTFSITHMTNLTHLNLSHNSLMTLPKEVRDHLDLVAENRTVTVDLTFNRVACVCENIDFLRWMRDSKVSFGTYTNYICLQGDGSTKQMGDIFDTITRLEKECKDYVGMFFGTLISCLVGFIIIAVALVYRFRWKLRYMYYATRLVFKRQTLTQDTGHEFDVFVSFSSEDIDFIMGEMKARLEDDRGLRLCIHTRDFIPGQYIASNILDAIQKSRRILIVLTRALLESDWCNYELQMALMEEAHTGRDVLLFLLYENLPKHELPRDILFSIQSHTYIEFPHTEIEREPFWNRLADALRG